MMVERLERKFKDGLYIPNFSNLIMGREIDKRNFQESKLTDERISSLNSLADDASAKLDGDQRITITSFDKTTGNPAKIKSADAPAEKGNYIKRALDHLQIISAPLGFEATQPVEFSASPNYQEGSSGAVTVHIQQDYKGIPVFQAAQTVRFNPNGSLDETVGNTVSVNEEKEVKPLLSAVQATLKAANYIAVPQDDENEEQDDFGEPLTPSSVDLTGFEPKVISTIANLADQTTILEAGPFGDKIRANLLWFALSEDVLRLTWEITFTMPDLSEQYRTIVDSETGEVLYCRQLVQSLVRGNVYSIDGSNVPTLIDFPRPWNSYGLPVPQNFPNSPDEWVTTNNTQAEGNCVLARLGVNGSTVSGSVEGGNLVFSPNDPIGDEQKVLNIFYYNCVMHDFFYLLGFREAQGNFQLDNFQRGGIPGDRVDARAHSGPVSGTANMSTPVDGSGPVMNMGLVRSTNRHTAFDSTVVFHEYMHGVTNRLVGGPQNIHSLDSPQSAGMGEGWGDYIACTINQTEVVGAWVVDKPSGIRKFPYNNQFPDHFGSLGAGRYTQVHNIGEIWCAALLEMNRRITWQLGIQLVVDALKLSPTNPSFLNMRDSILAALDNKLLAGQLTDLEHTDVVIGIWGAFSRFGMGPNAQSNGAQLSGIVADFDVPVLEVVVSNGEEDLLVSNG
jgi:extracellular elastinolytic metalloproteinase